jgi:Tfp pilus assembly protein PilF
LLPTAGDRAEPPATANAGAWDAYMQASASIHRGTPDDIRRAVQQLENAVQHDASFGAAWARLAEAHHMLVMMGVVAPRDAYPAARTAARRALTTAPNLPAAHLASGLIHLWYDWNPDAAAAAFQRALASNPSLAAAHHDYAWALVALGRPADAIQHMTRARDLDPISTRANNDVGWLHLFVRQPEQAARACQHTLAIDHHSLEAQACLERSYAQRQLFEAALQAARATLPVTEDVPPGAPGAAGLREIWTLRLRQLERAAETRWINPYTIAVHHALTGAPDRALAALEDAYRQRVGMLVFLARDPAMDSLRGNPHFDALVRRISATAP